MKYEYMVEVVLIESGLQEYLNELGSRGWRLVAIEKVALVSPLKGTEHHTQMIFEREKAE